MGIFRLLTSFFIMSLIILQYDAEVEHKPAGCGSLVHRKFADLGREVRGRGVDLVDKTRTHFAPAGRPGPVQQTDCVQCAHAY